MERDDDNNDDYDVSAPYCHAVENIIIFCCELDLNFLSGQRLFSNQQEVYSRILYFYVIIHRT
jgi:hypothetical protein